MTHDVGLMGYPSGGEASGKFPVITAVQWLPAKSVLGGEATDFTPWLAQPHILGLLGASLRLDGLSALAQEHPVLGKRLDLLATAEDEHGEDVAVCIENQYGVTDADHLGRLIAYLAQHERGRAVWIVEDVHDAYVAAVRFLNRTSTEDVGYYLVQVRFTHGEDAGFQVHFEVLAAPIAWERATQGGGKRPLNKSKLAWMTSLHEAVAPELLGAGFPSMNLHARGSYIWARWPSDVWLRTYGKNLLVRARQDQILVAVFVNSYASREANSAAIDVLEETYASELTQRLPTGSVIQWRAAQAGTTEQVRVILQGVGYPDGDIAEAATWSTDVARAWVEILRSQPIVDLDDRVASLSGSAAHVDVDDATDDAIGV
jgi:hypothetical protein